VELGRLEPPAGLPAGDMSPKDVSSDGYQHRSWAKTQPRKIMPNVVLRKREDTGQGGQRPDKKRLNLSDMLKNAKKVTDQFVKPIMTESFADHISNPFLDEIEEGLINKYAAFQRRNDPIFNEEFGRYYHSFRQHAYKAACKRMDKSPLNDSVPTRELKGVCFAPRDEFVYWEKEPDKTYIAENVRISLPSPIVRLFEYNQYEASRIYSGLDGGNVSTEEVWLKYNTSLTVPEARIYIEELDELKYIYKNFWYMVKYNRNEWLRSLYLRPDSKCTFNYTSKFTFERDMLRADNEVPFCVEGHLFFITVEELYSWIEYYRKPGKSYGIGECESQETLAYALLLNKVYGIREDFVKSRITPDEVKTVLAGIAAELDIFVPPSRNEEEDDDDEDARILALMKGNISGLEKARLAEQEFEEKIVTLKTKINFGNIDLSQFEDWDDDDSFVDSDDERERERIPLVEEDLPYEFGLHTSNEEYESLVSMGILEPQDDNVSEISDADSDTMGEQRLTPLEALGIDLIDPSRDKSRQPQVRRVGLVWDPGGGSRPIRLRAAALTRNSRR